MNRVKFHVKKGDEEIEKGSREESGMIETKEMTVIPSEAEGSRSGLLDFTAGFFDSASLRSE